MNRNINHPSRIKITQDQIQPWNAQDSNQLNPIQSTMLQNYQPINRHTISFNPEVVNIQEVNSKKPVVKGLNFIDNLRRYEKKKAEEISIKRDTNFIQKNKQKLIEDFSVLPQQSKNTNMLMSNLFILDKNFKNMGQNLSSSVQPINWSLMMYYETEKSIKKHRHKDIQSFLRFQSQRKEHQSKRQVTRQKSQINQANFSKFQQDQFQKMLKLKEGIRRRNKRSASSSSRQKAEETQPSVDEIRQSQCSPQRFRRQALEQKRAIPNTSYSARVMGKSNPISAKKQIIGIKNIMATPKIEPLSGLRMIHSSQKNRPLNKLLNINGNKVQNAKKFNNNV